MIVLWRFSWLLMMDVYSLFLQSDAELTWPDTYCIVNTTYWRLHCDFPAKTEITEIIVKNHIFKLLTFIFKMTQFIVLTSEVVGNPARDYVQ